MDTYAQSFGVLNYSGLLYDTNDTDTPIFNSLGRKQTNSVKFAVTSTYASGAPSQPAISETASLTAPEAKVVTRAQEYNVTQIFQKATAVSYAKLSNAGTLSGINVANQASNVQNELDFQVGVKMKEMRKDLEYTALFGAFNEATNDGEINKTKGFANAIKSATTVTAEEDELKPDYVDEVLMKISQQNAPTDGLVLVMNAVQKRQLCKWYSKENGFLLPATRNVGGVNIDTIITPFGTVGVMVHPMMTAGTVLVLNLSVASGVEQPVPEKGNFFWEELSKTGAGIKGEIFGQWGLDYGPSWYHGKITNLSATYVKKDYVQEVKSLE